MRQVRLLVSNQVWHQTSNQVQNMVRDGDIRKQLTRQIYSQVWNIQRLLEEKLWKS